MCLSGLIGFNCVLIAAILLEDPLPADFDQQEKAAIAKEHPVFLGNGVRNGWADATSIQIWTRTTSSAEMNWEGKKFIRLDRQALRPLIQSRDPEQQLRAQIPEGAQLAEMEGACPGTTGLVRLVYWPLATGQTFEPPFETPGDAQRSPPITTSAESDFTAQWRLQNLQPETRYCVMVQATRPGDVNFENSTVYWAKFTTAHTADSKSPVRFCMTTCHDFPRRDAGQQGHTIYSSMPGQQPHFTVHAGDVEYYDQAYPFGLSIELMRFHWERLFALPLNRKFYSTQTTYFMKDDHDTLKNDCWPGQRYGSVTFEQGRDLFNKEQFASNDVPYKTIRWGQDLQIWMLEGRDFRSPNNMADGPEKTILGDEQKRWLRETLQSSEATFKVIFSPTPVLGPDRDGKRDNHANVNFAHEGREIRELFASYKNVIVMCGDRHWQYATESVEDGLWEFGCGPGSKKHQLGWKKGDQREQHRFLRVAGGYLAGEIRRNEQDTPHLSVRHFDVDGNQVNEIVLKAK